MTDPAHADRVWELSERLAGQAPEVRNIPAGAFIESLSMTRYPADAPIP